jgi:class 3 adenylate cyclase
VPTCTGCQAPNPAGNRFCGQCGVSLDVRSCSFCGAANPGGQSFCGQCGVSLGEVVLSSSPAVTDERKLATVLFADVVGFTSLAERTDHELVARMVDAAFRRLAEVVVEHGGIVDKYMGDSVMAVFGVPVAHDDDAERAVAAGLAMRHVQGDLAFSIGINSGEVTATRVAGGAETTVIGDVVNVAARLEKVAGAGEVLCGKLTAELAGRRVEFREREPVLLKGKAQPVEVREAVALRGSREARAGGGGETPLFGRDDELEFLRAQWRRVRRDRRPHFVLLCGEAGSGKTRLLDELGQQASGEGLVVWTAYPAYGAMGGARVAAEIAAQLGPIDNPQIAARIRSIGGELDPSLQSIDPAALRQEQTWAVGRLLRDRAASEPILIAIDDMHRSGDRTLEMLVELSGRILDIPLLVVLAGRTEPGEWLTRFPAATTIRLSPLHSVHAAALASALVPDKPLAPETADFFVHRAGGNPLYIRELVTLARSQGALVDEGDHYGLQPHAAIPASLHALLAARLDALDPRQKLVLQHVAVLGEAADAEHVAKLGCPDAAAVLRSLADDGLVSERPDGRFETVDALLSEVAYETLPRNTRGELHREAAALASGTEERARHLNHAAEYLADDELAAAEAADALASAAQDLIEVSRHLDALALLERAVVIGYDRSPGLLALARIQNLCGREKEALETLAKIADDPDDPSVAVERDHTAANSMTFLDPAWAVPRLEEVAERWQALGDISKEAWARSNAGVAHFNQSHMREAAAQLEAGLALFEQAGDRWGAVNASSFLALVIPTDRRVARWLAGALGFADETGDKSRQISALTTLCWHHFFRSFCGTAASMAEAEGFARRLGELTEEVGANELAVHGFALLAIMARFTGRLDEASAHVAAVQRVSSKLRHGEPWLGWAASFAVTMACGAVSAAPPYPPDGLSDPVAGVARLIVEIELTMAGRGQEVLAHLDSDPRKELGPFGEMAGLLNGLALQLSGRSEHARPWIERAALAAEALDASGAVLGAAALLAEVVGDVTELPPAVPAASLGELLVLRARAIAGEEEAAELFKQSCLVLAMPGLAAGL